MSDSGYVSVGRIVGAHGIKGEVSVFPLTAEDARFDAGVRMWLSDRPDGSGRRYTAEILGARRHKGRWLLRLDRIADRTQAEQRRGWFLIVPTADVEAALDEDEFLLHALVGRTVETPDGRPLGRVCEVLETRGAPLLEIGEPGAPRRLLPFVREFVVQVREDALVVKPPLGWEEL